MKDKTKLVTSGRPHARPAHPVNPPVERASTYIYPTYDDFIEGGRLIKYGRLGTPTHRALEETVTALEGGHSTRLTASGLQACITAILAFVESGDHILMVDSVYDPTRNFCTRFLKRFGVETTYYPPLASLDELRKLANERTKVIFAESPGSLTFEVQDMSMLASFAKDIGAKLIADNTWAAGYYCKPISLGADVSVQAATKYLSGHADGLLGTITSADEHAARAIFLSQRLLGNNIGADDAALAHRGARSLAARLSVHQANGLALANWLKTQPEVAQILHPAFEECPGHQFWQRDFSGACGLFAAVLTPVSDTHIRKFFNSLKLFGMGFSWGGFESLCIHARPQNIRSAQKWTAPGPVLRFHAGLEDIDDLIGDLDHAFGAMRRG